MSGDDEGDAWPQTVRGQFDYLPIDRVIFGPRTVGRLPDEIMRLGARRVLILSTASLENRSPLVATVRDLLGHIAVGVCTGIRQHNPAAGVTTGVSMARDVAADAIVSLGGGSVIDAAKAIVMTLADANEKVIPHVALPTTLSAAEFSTLYGVTDDDTRVKKSHSERAATPRVVILDANLTEYTPDWLWLSSGLRALDHAVETYYSVNNQPATDAMALQAVRLLFQHLPLSVGKENRLSHRQECQIAAWFSFFGVVNISLGLSHILGRQIGPRYNVPHGYTSAVLLPRVMALHAPEESGRVCALAEAMGISTSGLSRDTCAQRAADTVANFVRELGLPGQLRDLQVPREDLENLAAGSDEALAVLLKSW